MLTLKTKTTFWNIKAHVFQTSTAFTDVIKKVS